MKKGRIKEAALELLLELVITIILFFVGLGVVSLFGKTNAFDNMYTDVVVLIGIGTIALVCIVVFFVVKIIKKALKK